MLDDVTVDLDNAMEPELQVPPPTSEQWGKVLNAISDAVCVRGEARKTYYLAKALREAGVDVDALFAKWKSQGSDIPPIQYPSPA